MIAFRRSLSPNFFEINVRLGATVLPSFPALWHVRQLEANSFSPLLMSAFDFKMLLMSYFLSATRSFCKLRGIPITFCFGADCGDSNVSQYIAVSAISVFVSLTCSLIALIAIGVLINPSAVNAYFLCFTDNDESLNLAMKSFAATGGWR